MTESTAVALDIGGLRIEKWLRVLPGKRLTGVGEHGGRTVLAKLFIAPGSGRHLARERRGLEALARHGIPTPKLLAVGSLAEGGHYLLTEFLEGAHILTEDDGANDGLGAVFETLGRMHVCGLVQDDAHLGNFLLRDETLYVIDGDAIRSGATGRDTLANLALLLAQLPSDRDAGPLLAAYRRGRPGFDAHGLNEAVARARRRRLDDVLSKCLRDCTLFKVEKRRNRFLAMLREEEAFLAPIVADPDRWLEAGTPLKQGRTSTLALVEHGGRKLVIKRYNIKGRGHALSRCWRPSRAWHSWIEGHRLRFLGIATPRPLALVEERFGPLGALRGCAWLVTEHCGGPNLADRPPTEAEMGAVNALFGRLAAERISHGDMKATNLLWDGDRIALVDLDAMRAHRRAGPFARAEGKDRARFIENWPAGSPLRDI